MSFVMFFLPLVSLSFVLLLHLFALFFLCLFLLLLFLFLLLLFLFLLLLNGPFAMVPKVNVNSQLEGPKWPNLAPKGPWPGFAPKSRSKGSWPGFGAKRPGPSGARSKLHSQLEASESL